MLKRLRSWFRPQRSTPTIRRRATCRPTLEVLEDRRAPAVLTVTSLADGTAAGSALTLREAVMIVDGTLGRSLTSAEQASISGTLGNNDTIQFSLPSGPQTITLTGGALSITNPVAIVGPGAANLTLNANGADRVFYVGSSFSQNLGLVVSIAGLTIADGAQQYGAGLFNSATLTVSNTTFTGNTANNNGGGGIYNNGALTLTGCTFSNNSTVPGTDGSTAGGALCNISGGTVTMTSCTFTGNSAPGTGSHAGSGGAIGNSGQLTMTGCVLSGNSAASDGGAVYNDGTVTATSCAFTNNSAASDGGALHVAGTVTISNCLIANNTASSNGGGMEQSANTLNVTDTTFADNTAGSLGGALIIWGGPVTLTNVTITGNQATGGSSLNYGGGLWISTPPLLQNCIIAGNVGGTSANDIAGNVVDSRSANNLIGTTGSSGLVNDVQGNLVGVANPGLGSLADNGGPTPTIALVPGSPAIDAGNNAFVASGATDQRGFTRIVNGTVDMGAFEVQAATAPTASSLTLTGSPTAIQAGTTTTITVTALTATGSIATGYTGIVHFTSSDPLALLPADYTFTAADGGVHTFSATLKTAGTQSITATDTANASLTVTASGIAVTPAAASALVLSGFTSAITAGTAGSFTVTARDAFGNLATGYTGTAHFTSSDGQAILPANYTFTTADNGTHSFNATFQTAGTQSLTATDTGNPSVTGTLAPITVNPALVSSGPVLLVNSTADNTTPDNFLTLREAIMVVDGTLGRPLTPGEQAQITGTLGPNDAIQFNLPAGPQTITLTGGALSITKPVAINGPGPANLTINGNNHDRVFIVGQIWSRNLSLVASINGLTITGGSAAYGAGVLNFGTLTIANTTFTNNAAGSNGGGGLYNVGAVTLNACAFSNNSASTNTAGGGLENLSSGTATLTNCAFTGNTANGTGSSASSGGAIGNSGTTTITGSTFTSNFAASDGGAIYTDGSISISTSSFVNNTCHADGGAIRSGGSVTTISASTFTGSYASSVGGAIDTSDSTTFGAINSTFANNTAGSHGAAIYADPGSGAATLTNCTIAANTVTSTSSSGGGGLDAGRAVLLRNTIVAGNFRSGGKTADDIAGTVNSSSASNLIGIGGAGGLIDGVNGNLVGIANPGLGTLANNGGPTLTIALSAGSPAIDHGSNAFVTAGETDQRGLARIVNGTVDIGAFEVQTVTSVVNATTLTQTTMISNSTSTSSKPPRHHH